QYVPDFSAVPDLVADVARPGDVVITMGAGDVTMLGPEIMNSLQVKANRSAPGRSGVMRQMTEPVPGEVHTTPEPEEDFEGPRRRARREREQRRSAAARARAIEDARREAKRRVTAAATAPKPVERGVVRGLKVLTWGIVIAVLSVGLGLLLYFTPIMSVRNLVVDGLQALPRDEVVAAVAVPPGTPLLQVDTDKVANRVATIRRVASVRVQREYPSSLRVTVVERVPVAVKDL